jgi:RNA polymerase sigma-70 factor, ECF subfamily
VSGVSGRGAVAFAALGDAGNTVSRAADVARGFSDVQLVALARESRGEALEVMYGAYKSRIYTFLLRLLSDPEAADDLTQDVFTKACVALGSLTNEHRVLPWLYRIANNAAIDHVRRRRRFTWLRVGKLTGTGEEPLMPDEHGALPERDQVRAVLATLPAEQATAMLLHSLEGYSYKEIAEIQGCTLTAVRSRIARGRAAFRVSYATTEARGPS